MKETWQAMEKAVDQGYIKSIGISNFSIKVLNFVRNGPPKRNMLMAMTSESNSLCISSIARQCTEVQSSRAVLLLG